MNQLSNYFSQALEEWNFKSLVKCFKSTKKPLGPMYVLDLH